MADTSNVRAILWYLMKQKRQESRNKKEKEKVSIIDILMKRRKETFSRVNVVLACIHRLRMRDVWMHRRTTTWFDMVILLYTDEQWYQNFRVTKATFTFILHEIQGEIYRQDTAMRKAISAQHRFALTLLLSVNSRIPGNCTSLRCVNFFFVHLH